MNSIIHRARAQIRQSVLRDRRREPGVERLSRRLWPWREVWLPRWVALLAALDYLSTYVLLELSPRLYVYERGPLARWALHEGGFKLLLIVDALEVGILCLLATGVRLAFSRFGYHGYTRAAYVVMLLPYVLATSFATINNLAQTMVA